MAAAAKTAPSDAAPRAWPVLVVDDVEEIHAVTRLALRHHRFEGRPLELIEAYSGAEAREMLARRPDVALALLDVVMETEHAGLELVRHIRDTLGNKTVRIVLRTGQPGQAPEAQVVDEYEIDGYLSKTTTGAPQLRSAVTTSLRTYSLLRRLESREHQLRMTNQELERFAFAASHDLQTPLRNVQSLAQLLVKKAAGKLDEDARQILAMLADNAGSLHRLIQELLDYARLGSQKVSMGPVKLDEVLSKSRALLKALVEERGAVIEAEPLPEVEGSATQLEWLLRNLLDNAIKYQPGPAPRVEVRCRSDAGGWRLEVVDHGIGIPVEHRQGVLKMFKRLHTQDQYPGSGIGLAAVQRVADLHHGRVEIGETRGGGTTVTVHLPLRQPPRD